MATRRKDIDTTNDDDFNKLSTRTTQHDTGVNRQRVSTLYTKRATLKQQILDLIKYNILYYILITVYIVYCTLTLQYNTFILEPINHSLIITICFIFTTYTLYAYRCNAVTLVLYASYIGYTALYLCVYNSLQLHTRVVKNPTVPTYSHIIPAVIHCYGAIVNSVGLLYLYTLRQLNVPVTTSQTPQSATTASKKRNK